MPEPDFPPIGNWPYWDGDKLRAPLECVCGHMRVNHNAMAEQGISGLLCTMCSCSQYREAT